ncbi:MAG TPA: hypothetical protein VHA82_07995 [Ramlibacter sp.]|uniref:hypothetical protein n=1 Tax=Ramlibacter sp. TaxID=1917967 RepID=UPI002C29D3E4|nr:hypothetical protein [Ramlibacter sp.]HVZ43738.1 hypothetical protein [Ramlibacter sp.]
MTHRPRTPSVEQSQRRRSIDAGELPTQATPAAPAAPAAQEVTGQNSALAVARNWNPRRDLLAGVEAQIAGLLSVVGDKPFIQRRINALQSERTALQTAIATDHRVEPEAYLTHEAANLRRLLVKLERYQLELLDYKDRKPGEHYAYADLREVDECIERTQSEITAEKSRLGIS